MTSLLLKRFALVVLAIFSSSFHVLIAQRLDLDSLLSVNPEPLADREKVDLFIKIAETYGAADSTGSVGYARKAQSLAEGIGYATGLIDAQYLEAAMYMSLGHIPLAAEGFQKVVDASRVIGYKPGEADGLNGLGATRDFQGDYTGALIYLFECLKINEELGDSISVGGRYNNIGLVYAAQDDFPNAIKYFTSALDIYEPLGRTRSIALTSANLGEIYLGQNQLEQASALFDRSLTLYRQLNIPQGIAAGYSNLAKLAKKKDDVENAIYNFTRALNIYEEIGHQQFRGEMRIFLGVCHYRKGEWQRAKQFLEKGLEIALEARHMLSIRESWEYLALVHEKLGDYPAALAAQKQFKLAADSVLNTNQTRSLTKLQAEYEFQKERDAIAFEHQKTQFAFEQELQKRRNFFNAALGGGALILIICIIVYWAYLLKRRSNRTLQQKNDLINRKNEELTTKNNEISELRNIEKKMAEEALALKERELTAVTMLSHEKNSLLEQLGDHIKIVSTKVDKEVIPDLKEISRIIKSNLSVESWSTFTYQFEKVHPKFFNDLKNQYEALTQNDLRMCAYLKVGMGNKEIASISNITNAGVKKSLNRLKKKLQLGAETDLREFLMNF